MDRPASRKILDDVTEEAVAPIHGTRSQICVSFWILWTMHVLKASPFKRSGICLLKQCRIRDY